MYAKPNKYKTLVRALNAMDGMDNKGSIVANVELVFTLAEALHLSGETILVGSFLLTGTPMPGGYLTNLSADQRRMSANARQIVGLDSRFAWEAALRDYAEIPIAYRNYDVSVTNLDKQIIDGCKLTTPNQPAHLERYQQILSEPLPFDTVKVHVPVADQTYTFSVNTPAGIRHGRVKFNADHLKLLDTTLSAQWFDTVRPRQPFSINLGNLRETAAVLDQHEDRLGNRVHWVEDLAKIRFYHVEGEKTRANLNRSDVLTIDGFFHMAGIVSSGKTTLATLIAAHAILNEWKVRITFVVGDTNTAIQLSHRFNAWFRDDPAKDAPVAVPVLGQRTRHVHLERLLVSNDYRETKKRNQPHWGERWVNPVCPLESLVMWTDEGVDQIPLGQEPCQQLRLPTDSKAEKRVRRHVCPLFGVCPSKQMHRDLPEAKLWITTPGAMAQAGVPRQLEERPIKFGDLIYEQSDLVIFDEAETIVDWFDKTYAYDFPLTDGEKGLLDRLDDEVTEYLRKNRTAPLEYQKWVFAERAANKAVTGILTSLNQSHTESLGLLRRWLKTGRLTRNSLSWRLARRLAGFKEYELRTDLPDEQLRREEEATRAVIRYFEKLDDMSNPFQPPSQPLADDAPADMRGAYALAEIMQQMNTAGQDVTRTELIARCKEWIETFFPDIQEKIDALRQTLEASTDDFDKRYLAKGELDTKSDDLAVRLYFTLWVVVLDWHRNVVFNQWHLKPDDIRGEQPNQRIPQNLRRILPIPALGSQYGLYNAPIAKSESADPNRLTQFIYLNVGRWYVLNFHRLRTDLDGLRGPNVLAMSGTSYLPDSSRFNLQVPPRGVLAPDDRTQSGLQASYFEFKPFYDEQNQPISVSGVSEKNAALRKMIQAMLKNGALAGGFLEDILVELRTKAKIDPDNWKDRARVLMFTNSYKQAKTVARTLQKEWPEMANRIFYLCKGKDDQDYEAATEDASSNIQRIDIEQFAADPDRVILVAPMASIGRGFNILNKNRPMALAAFGAVFFLTRPMDQPGDMLVMAQEINRYTVQWANHEGLPSAFEGADGLYGNAITLRNVMRDLWRNIELRRGYASLSYPADGGTTTDLEETLLIRPRADLAATTAGVIIQAAGRLLRGGVPFHAYFTDAAWSPQTALQGKAIRENADTSLLQAMIEVLATYADPADAVGNALYGDLSNSLSFTVGLNNN